MCCTLNLQVDLRLLSKDSKPAMHLTMLPKYYSFSQVAWPGMPRNVVLAVFEGRYTMELRKSVNN